MQKEIGEINNLHLTQSIQDAIIGTYNECKELAVKYFVFYTVF